MVTYIVFFFFNIEEKNFIIKTFSSVVKVALTAYETDNCDTSLPLKFGTA